MVFIVSSIIWDKNTIIELDIKYKWFENATLFYEYHSQNATLKEMVKERLLKPLYLFVWYMMGNHVLDSGYSFMCSLGEAYYSRYAYSDRIVQ